MNKTIAEIREVHRKYQDLMRAEGNLTRQVRAICRRVHCTCRPIPKKGSAEHAKHLGAAQSAYTKAVAAHRGKSTGKGADLALVAYVAPYLNARDEITTAKDEAEKSLKKLVRQLPIWDWAKGVRGLGETTLGHLLGESGDLSLYASPAKLWKRFGVGLVDVGEGFERQRRVTDAAKALVHAYAPSRRSILYMAGQWLVMAKDPRYYAVYQERKDHEKQAAIDRGLAVVPAGKIPKDAKHLYMSEGHVNLRAKRYMEKRLLRDLWRAWIELHGRAEGVPVVEPHAEDIAA